MRYDQAVADLPFQNTLEQRNSADEALEEFCAQAYGLEVTIGNDPSRFWAAAVLARRAWPPGLTKRMVSDFSERNSWRKKRKHTRLHNVEATTRCFSLLTE